MRNVFDKLTDALILIEIVNKTQETRWDKLVEMVEDVKAKATENSNGEQLPYSKPPGETSI
jgi:hypothetical protein